MSDAERRALAGSLRIQVAAIRTAERSARGRAGDVWQILAECHAAAAEIYERKLKELEENDG